MTTTHGEQLNIAPTQLCRTKGRSRYWIFAMMLVHDRLQEVSTMQLSLTRRQSQKCWLNCPWWWCTAVYGKWNWRNRAWREDKNANIGDLHCRRRLATKVTLLQSNNTWRKCKTTNKREKQSRTGERSVNLPLPLHWRLTYSNTAPLKFQCLIRWRTEID